MPKCIDHPALYAFLSYTTIKAYKALLSNKFYIVPTVLRGNPYLGLLLWLIKMQSTQELGCDKKRFQTTQQPSA